MSIASEISRLQSAKAGLKTAIEGKGVTVSSSATLEDYPDYVDAIQTGGGNSFPVPKMQSIREQFFGATFNDDVVLDYDGAVITRSAEAAFQNADINGTLTIKNLTIMGEAASLLRTMTSVTKVIFVNCTIKPTGFTSGCYFSRTLEEIEGEFDFSSCTGTNPLNSAFYNVGELKEVRIKQNTIKRNITFSGDSKLSNNSLISIANALDANETGYTLTLHATPKATCSTLMGNNNSGTFEADAQGSMSLATFISTIKGWTLA